MESSTINSTSLPPLLQRYSWVELLQIHAPEANMLDKVVSPIFYLIGFVGNTISAKIWLERRMRINNSSAIYLATLSITDLIFLILHIIMELKYAWGVEVLDFPVVCEVFFLLYQLVQYLSPILVLAFTAERYIAVCHPFLKERYCTPSKAVRLVCILISFCVLLSAIQAYFWSYYDKACQVRIEVTIGGELSLWSIWAWASEILTFFLVPFIILIFNIFVIVEVRKLSRSGRTMLPWQAPTSSATAATTVMLLSVSFYVILTTIPASVVFSLHYDEGDGSLTDDEVRQDPTWQKYFHFLFVRKIVEEICLTHFSCNIFLYIITGTQFRKALFDTLKLKRCVKESKYAEVNVASNSVTYQTRL